MAFPLMNLVALLIFAYSTWPIEDKMLELELSHSSEPTLRNHT